MSDRHQIGALLSSIEDLALEVDTDPLGIADEINAKYEAEKPTLNCWDPRDDGYEYGLDIAEQIARGDTK